jgi:hypothetical protein
VRRLSLRDPEVVDERHPIARSIDDLVHRVRDAKVAGKVHVSVAWKVAQNTSAKIAADLERLGPLIESPVAATAALAQKEVSVVIQRLERLQQSDVPGAIERGLFLTLFTAFDAFTGDLLRSLFSRKPDLFSSLDRSIPLSEVLAANSIQAIHESVVEAEIEAHRRKSHSEQFTDLENRFGIKLKAFDNWPQFVECTQRRNLLTHADGRVSGQYRKLCVEAGIEEKLLAKEGDYLDLGAKYFQDSCELIVEVGFKLGQTLWRKTLPGELAEAEEHLSDTLFATLRSANWSRARMMGEFGMNQKKWTSERHRRTVLINFVQALMRSGEADRAIRTLDEVDWSASSAEFQLAEDVLRERYEQAANRMRQIGSQRSQVTEQAYHAWPLFLEFRETSVFAEAYFDVFGHSYSSKLGAEVASAQKEAAIEVVEAAKLSSGQEANLETEVSEPAQAASDPLAE